MDDINFKFHEDLKNEILNYNYSLIEKMLVRLDLKQKCYLGHHSLKLEDYLKIEEKYFNIEEHDFSSLTIDKIKILYDYWSNVFMNDITFNINIKNNYIKLHHLINNKSKV